jgi:hypothetical protein
MTDLSPAAQQVFWEFNRAASGKPDDWHYLPAIAAALRAAVAHTQQHRGLGVWECDADELLAIAAELETFATENQ